MASSSISSSANSNNVKNKTLQSKELNKNFLKGFSFTPWEENALKDPRALSSLNELKKTGTEYVALCFFWFQENLSSTAIFPDYNEYSVNETDIVNFIDKIHSTGLKVVLKPMLDPKTGEWRINIRPPADSQWYQSYLSYMVHWAKVAEQHSVEIFVMGSELDGTVENTERWLEIIAAVRAVYHGEITYGVNYDRYEIVKFWDKLDYIGIDGYFPLTNENNPSVEELLKGWHNYIGDLEQYSRENNKSIIFVEIGYRSILGTNKDPGNWENSGIFNEDEQANCYEAAFEAFHDKLWLKGFFWWNWQALPEQGDQVGYTPHNKKAERILAEWYNGTVSTNSNNLDNNTTRLYYSSETIIIALTLFPFTSVPFIRKRKNSRYF